MNTSLTCARLHRIGCWFPGLKIDAADERVLTGFGLGLGDPADDVAGVQDVDVTAQAIDVGLAGGLVEGNADGWLPISMRRNW